MELIVFPIVISKMAVQKLQTKLVWQVVVQVELYIINLI